MVSRHTLTWIFSIVALIASAFMAGLMWPQEVSEIVVTKSEQEELILDLQDGKITGKTPVDSIFMTQENVIGPDTDFSIEASKFFPLHWWGKDWAIVLNLTFDPAALETIINEAPTDVSGGFNVDSFVASKSGSKYHPTTDCHFADRIKPENKVYFETEQQAQAAGYDPSSCFK